MFFLKDKNGKIGIITLIVACLFLIVQRVITSATVNPQYDAYQGRYYIYQIINATTLIGINLVPLFLGYSYQRFRIKNFINKIGSFYLIFFFGAMFCNLIVFFARTYMNSHDFWTVLFPISQNTFVFGTSCMLGVLLLRWLSATLDDLDDRKLGLLIKLSTLLFVLLPTLFSKDLWAFQNGQNIVWIFYLLVLGYAIKRLELDRKVHHTLIHLGISFSIFILLIPAMVIISKVVNGDVSSALRFSVPYSAFAMYYTFSLFLVLQKTVQNRINIQLYMKKAATLLIITQVVTNWSLNNYIIGTYYRVDLSASGFNWLKSIFLFIMFYCATTIVITIVSLLLQKIPIYKRLEQKISFTNYKELLDKLKRIVKWLHSRRKVLYVTIFFYLFTALQMFLLSPHDSLSVAVKTLIGIFAINQLAMILTTIIVMLFFMLIYLLTNKFWYAGLITFLIDSLLTISSILKISLREEPVLPSDLKMIEGFNELIGMVNPVIIIITVISLIILIVISFIFQRRITKLYSLKISIKKRVTGIIAILVFFSTIFFVNHKNSPSYLLFYGFSINKTFFNQAEAVKGNGPLLQFLINVDVKIMDKPEGYSKDTIQKIMKKYESRAKEINENRNDWAKNQTVIFCLSESFSDPSRLPNLTLESDPIPYIQGLKKDNTGGLMMSVGYGGGTANMEWEGLTGLNVSNLSETLVTPYTQLVEQQNSSPNITNLFEKKIAIHPYTATLYKRKDVFEKFGFQKFYYDGSPNKLEYIDKIDDSPRVSDESAFRETLKHINGNTDKTQFIQLSTMQNHMPYPDYYDSYDFDFKGSAMVSGRTQELKTYMQGIHYTDQAVKKFIEELDKIEKPITFVFYGDHLPSIYSGLKMSQYGLELHQTDYFIYSNKYSREQSKKLDKKVVSTNDFPAMALDQANLKVPPFYALLTDATNDLPTATNDPYSSVSNRYNGSQVFISDDNKILSEKNLSKEQRDLLADYKMIQYDLTAGKQYAAKWASQTNQ